jgi:hypothetical protein
MHQVAVKKEQQKMYEADRNRNKADMIKMFMEAKDPEEKKQIDLSLKLANISDVIREDANKQGIDLWDKPDQELIGNFVNDNPEYKTTITDYLNGKIQTVDVAKQIGLIPEEVVEEKN